MRIKALTIAVNPAVENQQSEPIKDHADSTKTDLETTKKSIDAPVESAKDEPNSEKAKKQ
jgi:hypothetical protein